MEVLEIILVVIFVCIAIEIIFRAYYKLQYGRNYHVSIKFPWKRSHVVPHPFLSFAYKRNEIIDRNQPIPYAIHPNKYYSFHKPLCINNMGHFGKDFTIENPENVLRIACLGASTTANNIADKNRDYNYPELLEKFLNDKLTELNYSKNIEVYNCGIGGWMSPDILIDFQLNILPTKPDYIILYHGYNDLSVFLTDNFSLDYSHARRNLGEMIHIIKRAYLFPKIKFWHSYECLKDNLLATGNVRNDVTRLILKQQPDISNKFHDLVVENNILKNILIICQYYKIRCILSSFAHYEFTNDDVRKKYGEGVKKQNVLRHELAKEFNSIFVDQANLIPSEDKYFVDSMHFTPEGMVFLANNFGQALVDDLIKRNEIKN